MKVFSKKKYIEWHKKYGVDVSDEEFDTRDDVWYNRCDGKEVNKKGEVIGEGGAVIDGKTIYYTVMDEWCEEVDDVKIATPIIPKELNTQRCLHCAKGEPMYCEDCYQKLITKIEDDLVDNEQLRKNIAELRKQLGEIRSDYNRLKGGETYDGEHIPRLD